MSDRLERLIARFMTAREPDVEILDGLLFLRDVADAAEMEMSIETGPLTIVAVKALRAWRQS